MRPKATKTKRAPRQERVRTAHKQVWPNPITSFASSTEKTPHHLRLPQKSEQVLNRRVTSSSRADETGPEGHEHPEETLRPTQEPLESQVQRRTSPFTELDTNLDQQLVERRRIEESLRESEERFRTFVDHAPSVVFMKTSDGRYLFVNRRFREAFQQRPPVLPELVPKLLEPVREQLEQLADNGHDPR